MARPKKVETDTASIVDEKNAAVETETPATIQPEETKAETKPKNEKPAEDKPFKDDDKITIKCAAYAGKSIILPTRTISLDEKGCCEVTGIEAKRLLTIPGYERA
jgi:hypothetical protein